MSKVLVTGDCGFLGSALAPRLITAGHDVLGLDPLPARSEDWPHIVDDLSDKTRLLQILRSKKVSHVIHAGGVSGPMVLPDEPAKVIAINVGGSLNLLQACLETGVSTFIYCSSVSALGDFYEQQPVGSDAPLRPLNTYGCSKAALDMVLRGLWQRVALDLCSLRFTSVYGPGRRTSLIIDEIVDAALHDREISTEPTSDWPFIYIDDAADAAIAACFSRLRRELYYFISYPEQVSLEHIVDAAAQSGMRPKITIDPLRPRVQRGPLDIGPAQRDFGFAPKINHRTGIARMIAARRAPHA
jgi:nucleoside-diphosphate-sugar epimerase